MYRKLASAVLVASAINAKYALAVGLGGMTMHSALNQPLDAEISLSSADDLDSSQILIGLASQAEFAKAGVERSFFLSDITFEVILDGKGGGVVKLHSTKRLNEPYLDLLLEARWPAGRVLRSYTALVDLPVYSESQSSAVDLGDGQQTSAPQAIQGPGASDTQRAQIQSSQPSYSAPSSEAKPKAFTPQASSSVTRTGGFTGNEYQIQANETLSSIASKLKPNSQVTLNQTMLAIQKLNPHAFVRNNINLIKAGAILRVPSEADVSQISASTAAKEVVQQTQEWRGAQLDATESRNEPIPRPSSSAEDGHLSLTSAGSGLANGKEKSAADSSALSQKLNATKENLQVSKLENQELNSRVDSLNSQVNQLKRMIELKDAELATLQKKLGKEPAASVKADAIAKKPDADKTEKKPVEAKAAEPVKALTEQVKPEVPKEKPIEKQVKPKKPAPKPEPKKPVKPVEEPVAELSMLDKVKANPLYIGILALVLIFGVVAFLFRRKAQAERQSMQENDISNFDFDQAVGEASLDNLGSHEIADDLESIADVESGMAESHALDDGHETVMQTSDPIGEADIYIAYGRYDQAAELLLNAIAATPNSTDLRTKLLEVYIESKNKAGFQQQYMELRSLGKAGAVSHAKELLTSADGVADWLDDLPADEGSSVSQDRDFDTDNSAVDQHDDFDLDLNDDAESGFSFKEEKPIEKASPAPVEDDFDLDLSDMDEASDVDFDLHESAKSLEAEDSDFDADLSLDLSDLDTGSGEAEVAFDLDSKTDEPEASLSNEELSMDMDELSFDLSDEFDEKPASEAQSDFSDLSSTDEVLDFDFEEPSTPVAVAEIASEMHEEDSSFEDFDLNLDEEPAAIPAAVEEESTLDFSDVDLGLDDGSGLVSSEPTMLRDSIDLSLHDEEMPFDDLSATESVFEFGSDVAESDIAEAVAQEIAVEVEEVPVSIAVASEVVEPHVSAPIASLESEDLEFLTDGDEVSTKLDLAQAYVDLGDVDGARDILLEVMKEGKEEQKAEAAALLDSLD